MHSVRSWPYQGLLFCLGWLFCLSLQAAPLRIGVSFSIPPYVLQEENRGIELDILRATLPDVQIVYLPLARTWQGLSTGELDGTINVHPGLIPGVYYSARVLTFHNRFFTQAAQIPSGSLHALSDLAGLKVAAFQYAHRILGEEYAANVASIPGYTETPKQILQVRQLVMGRVDAIVMEQRVFEYYLNQVRQEQPANAAPLPALAMHDLLPPTIYHFAFRDPAVRDSFDQQLTRLRANGQFAAILARYGVSE